MLHRFAISARQRLFACFVLAGSAAVLMATAQPADKSRPFTPVEAGVVDLSSNAVSLRVVRIDQRIPTGFDQVFKVNPSAVPDAIGTRPMFARKSGALTAMFPRAQYVQSQSGALVPLIPADTRFMIGEPEGTVPTPGATPSKSAVDRRADNSTGRAAGGATRHADSRSQLHNATVLDNPAPTLAGMLTDNDYRIRRVSELLQRAAEAEPPQVP